MDPEARLFICALQVVNVRKLNTCNLVLNQAILIFFNIFWAKEMLVTSKLMNGCVPLLL